MHDARRVHPWRSGLAVQRVIAAKGISLDDAVEVGEMVARALPFTVGAEAIIGCRRPAAAPSPLIDQINPDAPGSGSAKARSEYRDRGVIRVDDFCRHDIGPDHRRQRRDPPGGMANPVSECCAFDLDALARQDCRLAIERQAVEIF